MPLDRAHVTRASRIMIPVYVGFFAILGLNYLLTPHVRLIASPALDYTDGVMTLHAWGALFLAAAALMVVAMVSATRQLYLYGLLLCAISMVLFTAAAALAPFFSQASPGGWVWPGFVLAACFATYRSLSKGEVD